MGIPRKASMMFCNWRRPSRSKRLTLTEIVSTCKLNITTQFIGIDHTQCLYGKGTDSLLWALYKMHMFGLPHSHRDGNFKGSMEVASRKHTHTHTGAELWSQDRLVNRLPPCCCYGLVKEMLVTFFCSQYVINAVYWLLDNNCYGKKVPRIFQKPRQSMVMGPWWVSYSLLVCGWVYACNVQLIRTSWCSNDVVEAHALLGSWWRPCGQKAPIKYPFFIHLHSTYDCSNVSVTHCTSCVTLCGCVLCGAWPVVL